MTVAVRPLPSRRTTAGPRSAENATLAARDDLSHRVARFTVRLDGAVPDFVPGQYVSLGFMEQERFVQRPYSIASPPGNGDELEFFIRRVDGGALTSRLWLARPGARLRVGAPKGLFTLDRQDSRERLYVAAGTGLAPFLSILGGDAGQPGATHVVLLHGASHATDLGFAERFAAWRRAGLPLDYLPTVSRPDDAGTPVWTGRTGRVESLLADVCTERSLSPVSTVAYLCGNPGMVDACGEILGARGFGPQDVRVERYQPAIAPSAARSTLPA